MLNLKVNWDKVDIQGSVYIGGMAHIEDGSKIIGPSIIGPNCRVCSGAIVDKNVIFKYSHISQGVKLLDKLVFGRYCVDKMGVSVDIKAAAPDWLITDTRQAIPAKLLGEQQAITELTAWSGSGGGLQSLAKI